MKYHKYISQYNLGASTVEIQCEKYMDFTLSTGSLQQPHTEQVEMPMLLMMQCAIAQHSSRSTRNIRHWTSLM